MGLLRVIIILAFAASAHAASLIRTNLYHSMCDASGAVALGNDLFVIADDEDNKLRIYRSDQDGPPVQLFDMSTFLHVDPKEPEVDLEGAARLGDRIYWITSHGRNRQGKYRESRLRFFATDIKQTPAGPQLQAVGRYYSALLLDLFNDPRLARFNLDDASQLAPKAPGGLNIEGLSATPDGKLIIGFRNPIPRQGALLVPLLNPAEAVEGKPLKLGAPILLNLDKRGVRSMALLGNEYIIIAGSSNQKPKPQLFRWAGGSSKPVPVALPWGDITPEALAIYPGRKEIQIFSDDGTRDINGKPCKEAPPENRLFRAVWLSL